LTQNSYRPDDMGDVEIKAFPNPFSGELTIEVSGYRGEIVNLQILSMMGQVVKSSEEDVSATGKITMELSDFVSGVYFVRVKGDNVDQTLKLIKQ